MNCTSASSMALKLMLAATALLIVSGCAGVPPQHIVADRMEYGEVIADSWKRQTLLNVVRMRYADAPVFLEVSSIINSYSVGGKSNAAATLPSRTNPNVFGLGVEGSWSNTPTVTYQPLMGDRFTKSLLQPVPPAAIFQLIQGGWPVDLVLNTVTSSINGLRNSFAGVTADEDYTRFIDAMLRIQRSGNLGIRVEARPSGNAVVVVINPEGRSASLIEDSRLVQQLLSLDEGTGEFDIAYGLVPKHGREVAVLSRSMLEIILQLGFGVDLPAGHSTDGRALPGNRKTGDMIARPLVHVLSGSVAPPDAYAAVQYKGHWYWIDDHDIASKRAFTFLLILFSLAETGQSSAMPVVTVPSR